MNNVFGSKMKICICSIYIPFWRFVQVLAHVYWRNES